MDEAESRDTEAGSADAVQEDQARAEVKELTRVIAMQTQAIYALIEQNGILMDSLINEEAEKEETGLGYLNG